MKRYIIKRNGKYLCDFAFRKGYDYRSKYELSAFANIYSCSAITEKLKSLASIYDGDIVMEHI